jgi:GTPase
MKFVDEARIFVKAGDGGRGSASFRREKYVPRGGPDGGDGGRGGDVVIFGKRDLASLLDFKYRHTFRAENGKNGSGKNKTGRGGKDETIYLPLGTLVYDERDKTLLCDIVSENARYVVAKGGAGGRGNTRFVTSAHRTPFEFETGEAGEERHLALALKLLADVGIVGLPNAGKSTLISRLTSARPRIADYPFTTLTPTLGVCRHKDSTFILADIPGIVEGASRGKGLGLAFLKHVERTGTLVVVLDGSTGKAERDYETLLRELSLYSSSLISKKRIVILNKIDVASESDLARYEAYLSMKGESVRRVSALKGLGVGELRAFIGRQENQGGGSIPQ